MIHSGLENGSSDMTKPFNLLTEKSLPLYQILASCWSGIGAYNRICCLTGKLKNAAHLVLEQSTCSSSNWMRNDLPLANPPANMSCLSHFITMSVVGSLTTGRGHQRVTVSLRNRCGFKCRQTGSGHSELHSEGTMTNVDLRLWKCCF